MPKFLIVNSDDFGISPGVNRGILEAHHNGIVTSTTTMVNMPAAAEGLEKAHQSAPKLGLGLHFNLSFGAPVSAPEEVPSLVTEDGTFVSDYPQLMEKMAHFDPAEVERELNAQFLRFIRLAGTPPDHIDSHHGITYFHPAGLNTMLELAKEYHLPIRRLARPEPIDGSEQPASAEHTLTNELTAIIEKYGQPRQPDRLLDLIFDFETGDRLEPLKAGLKNLPEGYSELLVHVGYAEGLTEAYTTQREEELTAITDPSLKAIIESEGIELITFAELPL